MIDVGTLTFRGQNVEHLTYKGQQVDVLNVKGYTWGGSSPQEFSIKPILWDSANGTGYADRYGNIVESPIHVTGNCTFLGKVPDSLNLANATYSGTNSHVWTVPVDNWGFIFNRLYSYDMWAGGVSGTPFVDTETITVGDTSVQLTFKSELDEDNIHTLEGCYLSKVFRIPYTGGSGEIKLEIYPYTFGSSEYYNRPIDLYWWDYANGKSYEYTNGQFVDTVTGQTFIPLSNTIFNSLAITKSDAITATLSYSIKANAGSYQHYVLIYGNTIVNILQEPYSNVANRVYYGKASSPYYCDRRYQYFDRGTQAAVYPNDGTYLIHTIGSRIISSNTEEIVCPVADWTFAIPAYIFNNYNVSTVNSGGTSTPVTTSDANYTVTWGNTQYYGYVNTLPVTTKLLFEKK